MPANVTFKVTGSKRAMKAIRAFSDRAENLEEIGPEVHALLSIQHRRGFETRGRAIGENWPGYTGQEAQYGAIKKSILDTDDERLLRWEPGQERLFPSVVRPTHPEHVWRIKGGKFEFGTKVPYAANHQEGKGTGPEWAGSPRIKQRRFLSLTRETAAGVTRIVRRHMGL